MRITKKLLRTTKKSAQGRLVELYRLDDTPSLEQEFRRCFPNREGIDQMSPARMRYELLRDLLDLTIPDHWCE